MIPITYSRLNQTCEPVLRRFVQHLRHTFGTSLCYVGTTTRPTSPITEVRDIDVIIVFTRVDESHLRYVWKIIHRLHSEYNIILDARIHDLHRLTDLPAVNQYLLRLYLNDCVGTNPFSSFDIARKELDLACIRRMEERQSLIVQMMPRLVADSEQVRAIAQAVFDALRAFLVLEGHPFACKEDARDYVLRQYPGFEEIQHIYEGYVDPQAIVDVGGYVLDSLAVVKHLLHRSRRLPLRNAVLLINSPSSALPHPRDDYLSYDPNMPLGLVCLATYLKENDIPVELLDAYAENLGVLAIVDRIAAADAVPKLIGFNASSPNIHIVHQTARYLKRVFPGIQIVCGGPHASLAPDHTFSSPAIGYLVYGEGEIPLLRLAQAVFGGESMDVPPRIAGLATNVQGRPVGGEERDLLDLKTLHTPDFSILPLDRYFSVRKRLYVHTSRGCQFKCVYCSVPQCWGQRVREIPVGKLVTQIQELVAAYSPDEFQIVDDNFSHRQGRLIDNFCSQAKDANLSIRWKCQARADQLSADIVNRMALAGCFEVDLGIESGSERIQKYIRKNLDLDRTVDVVRAIHENGMTAKAFFMLGFPDESDEEIAATINYAITLKEAGLADMAVFPVMPFPGTEISRLTNKVVFQGAIIDDVDAYDRSFAAARLRKYKAKPEVSLNARFTPEQLRLLVKFAYQRFAVGVRVSDLGKELEQYAAMEEDLSYGV